MQSLFLTKGEANSVLKRYRRTNTILEELKQGNIERECREEICTYEEAREAYENDENTNEFWRNYIKGPNEDLGSGSGVDMESVYLVAPLMAGLLVIIIIVFAIWRYQVRKANHRQNAYVQTRHQANQPTRNVSVVVFGYNEHPVSPFARLHTQQPEAMTANYSNGNGLPAGFPVHGPPCSGSSGLLNSDLPPSYDEATGEVGNIRINDDAQHSEDPPKYEEIVTPQM